MSNHEHFTGQATDEFSVEDFDWGEPSQGISLDEVSPTFMYDAIREATLATEEAFGWAYIKRADINQSVGKLYKSRIIVTDAEKRAHIEEQYPQFSFLWDTATQHHDHPLSHIATELNEMEMTYDLVAKGKTYIDLFGNGRRNDKYKRKAVTVYTKATSKDYIRHQYPNVKSIQVQDITSLCDPKTDLGKIDDVCITHALYYLTMDEVSAIVNTSEKRRLRALIHRHPASSGSLSFGELNYAVSEEGIVRQENALTGEYYEHPSLEALFHQSSAISKNGGVAWTIRSASPDSFFVDFVACPNEVAKVYKPLVEIAPESRTVIKVDGVRIASFLHWTWLSYSTVNGDVVLSDIDLFTKLRRYVSCKPRTGELMTQLAHYCRRLTNKMDIVATHGGGAHEINMGTLCDYVNAAFYVDVRKELETAIAFHKANSVMVNHLNSYYETGKMPTDLTTVTKILSVGAKCTIKGVDVLKDLASLPIEPVCHLVAQAKDATIKAGLLEGTIFGKTRNIEILDNFSALPGAMNRRRVVHNPW
jgi:hypothetical protein